MKLLTKEEEDAHYSAVLRGGTLGTVTGLIGGAAAVLAASKRFPTIQNLTLPMKAFLVTSSGTFVGIIAADHASRSYEASTHSEHQFLGEREARLRQEELASMSATERMWDFIRKEKYKLITVSWVASMVASWMLVSRNPTLTKGQKIVQARVYAQGLTVAVMAGTAAMEISDQRKGRGLLDKMKEKQAKTKEEEEEKKKKRKERYQGEELWKDMVDAEEERMKARDVKKQEKLNAEK
ncbi:hypothetical protein ACO22_03330 [Paracoccidioides brasiliensis]|uniref:HIG1 domain-containing protein n=1 Tax=Paracoccidioides brasiliensis TaxID=121759 RepID=A0A1D2JGB4_PARBR|nr:hypothetical protein ACO22_03330 [Paracoccidioides brasiliensis]